MWPVNHGHNHWVEQLSMVHIWATVKDSGHWLLFLYDLLVLFFPVSPVVHISLFSFAFIHWLSFFILNKNYVYLVIGSPSQFYTRDRKSLEVPNTTPSGNTLKFSKNSHSLQNLCSYDMIVDLKIEFDTYSIFSQLQY